jgi:hypothetical protein
MNISTRTRLAGATATLGMLLAFTACGTETVSETDPGTQSVANPKVRKAGGIGTTADAAERRAAADKARQDQAATDRWARGTNVENKLQGAGHPSQP